jgi:hypothetical protein
MLHARISLLGKTHVKYPSKSLEETEKNHYNIYETAPE